MRRRALALLPLAVLLPLRGGPPPGGPAEVRPRYTADGALLRPAGVERWVLVGTSTGLGYAESRRGASDGPGSFHAVHLEPTALDFWRREGRFRDGTMLALVIRRPQRPAAPGAAGWVAGELAAVELAVKDTARFAGGWAYFDFGRRGAGAAAPALPRAECERCHAEHAAVDHVFVQFYPALREGW